jgi:hydrogenase expression/formation protein HypE
VTHLPPGKLPASLLGELIRELPPAPPSVRLGPAIGEDACVLDVPAGALVVAADPITLTGSEVGAHAVIVNANDVAVTGVRPRWFLATVLLPTGTSPEDVRQLFAGMQRALDACGAHLVGGHTEVTASVRQPVVAGQMLGFAEDGRVVPTGGMRPADVVLQVGAAPVEGAAVLAAEATARLGGLEASVLERARAGLTDPGISVVEAAMRCVALGATALHDPTEGGLAAGLEELATASAVRLEIDRDGVAWFEPGLAVCQALGADPWCTLASGTLLAAFPSAAAPPAHEALEADGHVTRLLGTARAGSGAFDRDGAPILAPARDEVARLLA